MEDDFLWIKTIAGVIAIFFTVSVIGLVKKVFSLDRNKADKKDLERLETKIAEQNAKAEDSRSRIHEKLDRTIETNNANTLKLMELIKSNGKV